MYPLKFEPIYKEKIWGGRNIAKRFDKSIPAGNIGESWEIAAHQNGTSIISNGSLAGKNIMEAISLKGREILGESAPADYHDKFPLLIKILDAQDKLSVQVHPDDQYAAEHEDGELGKTEMWYVIDAKQNAKLVYGVKDGTSGETFTQSIKSGNLEDHLVEIEVEAGDVIYIPAGTLHAIEEGILLAEIQQNSDTTYRVYDWNRLGQDGKGRELHIDKALEVINFTEEVDVKVEGLEIEAKGFSRRILVASPYFITELLEVEQDYVNDTKADRFYILMALEGSAKIDYADGELEIKRGETVLLPAALGEYKIIGDCELLQTYIQAQEELRKELENHGYSQGQINRIKGL